MNIAAALQRVAAVARLWRPTPGTDLVGPVTAFTLMPAYVSPPARPAGAHRDPDGAIASHILHPPDYEPQHAVLDEVPLMMALVSGSPLLGATRDHCPYCGKPVNGPLATCRDCAAPDIADTVRAERAIEAASS